MSGLFEDIALFDHEIRTASRKASAVAFKRVEDRIGGYLRLAKTAEEREARLDFVSDDIRQICADVAEEYNTDADNLVEAIEDHLKGDLDKDLEDAPSAVGVGKQAGGHKPGCECGFCKNKGTIHKNKDSEDHDEDESDSGSEEESDSSVEASASPKVEGILSDEEKARKDASEPEWREKLKESEAAVTSALSAQDFVMLADAISKAPGASPALAEHFADHLAQTNPRFDRERFIAAASGNPLSGRDAPQQAVQPPQGPGGAQPTPAGPGPTIASRQAHPLIDEQGQPSLETGAVTAPCQHCGTPLQGMGTGMACPGCGAPTINEGFQNSMDSLLPDGSGGEFLGSVHRAEAPRDGGGATKTVKLPKGDGKAVGTGASPKIDHKTWKPNALNPSGNLPAEPEGIEMSGSPVPTRQQDVEDVRDYDKDFTEETGAVTEHQELPSAGPDGFSTERNISQDGQDGTWTGTDSQASPVTSPTLSSFIPDNQVESAIRSFEDKE